MILQYSNICKYFSLILIFLLKKKTVTVFAYDNVVFTVSHKNFVLSYTVSVSIWMSLPF